MGNDRFPRCRLRPALRPSTVLLDFVSRAKAGTSHVSFLLGLRVQQKFCRAASVALQIPRECSRRALWRPALSAKLSHTRDEPRSRWCRCFRGRWRSVRFLRLRPTPDGSVHAIADQFFLPREVFAVSATLIPRSRNGL